MPGPPPFLPSPLKNESTCKPEFKVAQGQKALEFPYKLCDLVLCRTRHNSKAGRRICLSGNRRRASTSGAAAFAYNLFCICRTIARADWAWGSWARSGEDTHTHTRAHTQTVHEFTQSIKACGKCSIANLLQYNIACLRVK